MLRAAIGVAILLVAVCAGLSLKYYRSREVISTTEWVRLMRKNDLRFDRATRAIGQVPSVLSPAKCGDGPFSSALWTGCDHHPTWPHRCASCSQRASRWRQPPMCV